MWQSMARTLFNKAKIARHLSAFASFDDAETKDRHDWQGMSAIKRLEIVEQLRQMNHADYDPAARRLPRLYTVVKSASC